MTWAPGDPVRIETERYVLRSLTPDDVTERYLAWLRDPDVTRYMNARFDDATAESLRRFVASHDDRDSFLLGIFVREGDVHVGNLRAECNLRHGHCFTGTMIGDRDYWGKGVVLEARAAFLDFLFGPVGVLKACGMIYADNAAGVFNYQSQGWVVEGILRNHVVSGDRRSDVIQFALFRDDWHTRREHGE